MTILGKAGKGVGARWSIRQIHSTVILNEVKYLFAIEAPSHYSAWQMTAEPAQASRGGYLASHEDRLCHPTLEKHADHMRHHPCCIDCTTVVDEDGRQGHSRSNREEASQPLA